MQERVQNTSLSLNVKSKKQENMGEQREMVKLENPPLTSHCLCVDVEELALASSFDGRDTHVPNGN